MRMSVNGTTSATLYISNGSGVWFAFNSVVRS
jgi:hypothetical protein